MPPVPTPAFTLESTVENGTATIYGHGRLVAGQTAILQSESKRLMARCKHIVVDLADVAYMDSLGLGAVLGLYASAKAQGCEWKIVHISPRVRKLLSLTNMLPLLEEAEEPEKRGRT